MQNDKPLDYLYPLRASVLDSPERDTSGELMIKNVRMGAAEYNKLLIKAAKEIADRLAMFCGPFSSNAAIPRAIKQTDMGAGIVDEFTKDGITILRNMRTDDVDFEHVRRMAIHIGERVDTACHDGTTTAMLLFCRLVEYLTSGMLSETARLVDADLRKAYATATYDLVTKLVSALDDMVHTPKSVLELIHADGLTEVTEKDVRYGIAYNQALIASKGDEELARGVATVTTSMPVEMYGHYVLLHSRLETEHRFKLEVQEHDLEIDSNLLISTLRNHRLAQQVLLEDADLIISSIPFVEMSPETETLLAHITPSSNMVELIGTGVTEKTPYFTRPTVIVAPEICSSLIVAMTTHNRLYPHAQIYPFSLQCPELLRGTYDKVITAMCDVDTVSDNTFNLLTPCIIRNVKVHHEGSKLRLYNLYEKTGKQFHPFYEKPCLNPRYTSVITDLITSIEDATVRHISTIADRDVNLMISLYKTAVCQKIVDLRICGSTHEMVHNRSVVEDAMGAALASLDRGFVLGGHLHLLTHLCDLWDDRGNMSRVERSVMNAFLHAFDDVIFAIYRQADDNLIFAGLRSPGKGGSVKKRHDFYCVPNACATEEIGRVLLRKLSDYGWSLLLKEGGVLIQPATGYYEQFKRLKDLLPKIVNTSALIDTSYNP